MVISVKAVREQVNSDLVITGLLRVKFDPRVTLQKEVSEELINFLENESTEPLFQQMSDLPKLRATVCPGFCMNQALEAHRRLY